MRISDWSSDVCSSDLDAVEIGQADDVARIDQVRVGDLRVGLPDLRPQPWMLQELARDVPRGVAAHDDIGIGVIATDALCHGDRKSVVSGKSVSVRVALGGRRIIKKKKKIKICT